MTVRSSSMAAISPVPPNRRDIGMVFQAYALFPTRPFVENISFGLRMKKTPKNEIEKKVDTVLEMVRLQETADRYPHQLSGGQQQRIALASRPGRATARPASG